MDNLELRMKYPCPDAKHTRYVNALCRLNDKVCILESGHECQCYEEYLAEIELDLAAANGTAYLGGTDGS